MIIPPRVRAALPHYYFYVVFERVWGCNLGYLYRSIGIAKFVTPCIVTAVQLQKAARYEGVTCSHCHRHHHHHHHHHQSLTKHATIHGSAIASTACDRLRKWNSDAASELRRMMQRVGMRGKTHARTHRYTHACTRCGMPGDDKKLRMLFAPGSGVK